MSKYGVISGPYFPVFSSNTGKYGPELTAYLDTFHAVQDIQILVFLSFQVFLHVSHSYCLMTEDKH